MLSRFVLNIYFVLLSTSFFAFGQTNEYAKYSFEQPHMGTRFLIVCYATDSVTANNAAKKAFDRIAELNNVLSDYHPESELSILMKQQQPGQSYKVSDDLWYMLNASREVSKKTDGLFDITVGNCTKLWRRAQRKKALPNKDAITHALANTGFQHIILDSVQQTVSFEKPEMKLDFGGIAKGYAADEAYKIFKYAGIERVMIDAGGDIFCGKAPPGKRGWEVKVISGLGDKDFEIILKNLAVATSGDLYRFIELDGVRYSHIVDPTACSPITQQISTTVISNFAEKADFMASSLNISGIGKRSRNMLKNYPQTYGLVFVKKSDKIIKKRYGNKRIRRKIKPKKR